MEFGAILGDRQLTMILDIKTVTPNLYEHYMKRNARVKEHKNKISKMLLPYVPVIQMPCTIKFIRLAPKFIDFHDNLPYSFKAIADSVTSEIIQDFRPGRADSNKGFTFEYDQVKSKVYGVKIEISW